MDLLQVVGTSWGFTGLEPVSVVDVNSFGNVLVEARDGSYWRICPEELSCEPIAATRKQFDNLRSSSEFREDWKMERFVSLARSTFGELPEGRCFCLKVPGVLGGTYDLENIATITIAELLRASGHIALQIRDLPDGTNVDLKITE